MDQKIYIEHEATLCSVSDLKEVWGNSRVLAQRYRRHLPATHPRGNPFRASKQAQAPAHGHRSPFCSLGVTPLLSLSLGDSRLETKRILRVSMRLPGDLTL